MSLQEFKVAAVIFDKIHNTPVVLLENSDLNRIIPIWIGTCEALSIAMVLNNEKYPRPLTHDLILSILDKLEYEIKRVIIYQVRDDVFYANIIVNLISDFEEEEEIIIDSRSSDAIALALRYGAKILVASDVVLESGIILRPPRNYEDNDEVENFLKKLKSKKGEDNAKGNRRKN